MEGEGMRQTMSRNTGRIAAVAVALLAILFAWGMWGTDRLVAQSMPKVVVLTSDFVLAGKFDTVRDVAAKQGVLLRVVNVDRDDEATLADAVAGSMLAILDAPREEDGRHVRERADVVLVASNVPWLLVSARGPQSGGGLDPAWIEPLYAYYRNGSRRNFENLFAWLAAGHAGSDQGTVPLPVEFPEYGIYHPDHPDLVVDSLARYRDWLGAERGQARPVLGIVLHQSFIGNMGTGHIDALIRRFESAGVLPVAFYHPTIASEGALDIVSEGGVAAVDVLVNFQVMYQGARREDYARLGVPVLQALTWRGGDAEDWRASEIGVPMSGVPFHLAIPEFAGLTDPLVVASVENDVVTLIPEQTDALVAKTLKMARLRAAENAEKRVALMFWNYPSGEKNLAASFMNVPRSLAHLTDEMQRRGYEVETLDEDAMIAATTALLAPFYREGRLAELVDAGNAGVLPLANYRAWFDALPGAVRERVVARWGEPEDDPMLAGEGDARFFVVPRQQLGNLVILPQPPRSRIGESAETSIYHDARVPLTHFYMAAYLYVREHFDAHALIHFGTHGSQEWTPGKERGLSVFDDPYLVLGDLPVVYPYIVDNIGEATQAKRRGRATIVSHQTPSFAPAGLHEQWMPLHDRMHEYHLLDEGAVKARTIEAVIVEAERLNMVEDLGWTVERARGDFVAFEAALHDWLHALAQTAQPLGLHSFGRSPEAGHRLSTAMQMVGNRLYDLLDLEDPDELFVEDWQELADSPPYQLLARHILDGVPVDEAAPELRLLIEEARQHFDALSASLEYDGLFAALDGRYLETHYGGDPIRNPESLPTGRNLYGFDPSRLPTEQAWLSGGEALASLLAAHRAEHGEDLRKLAVSLWSVEAMRHLGVLEAQVFHALGVRPVWDRFGRIGDVEIIDRETLGRARVDVVVSATGLYRDHFPNVMRLIARAVEKVADLDEPDNVVRANTLTLEADLLARGFDAEDARDFALTRIFSNQSGTYGTGLDDATLASDTWDDESKLAELYLQRMQYAFGPDERKWGRKHEGINLYATQLEGVQAAVLARSSNLYGMLTTDDPFQYLGGIGLAVRHVSGRTPSLYISNLRDAANAKVEPAARFLAAELRTRQFHPQWVATMQQEGYAGTLNVVGAMNNFWGWTSVAPEIVRDDQWQSFFDVYVEDSLGLDVREWFEEFNPAALAQIVERMLEAARKDYWQTDEATLRTLAELYIDAVERLDYLASTSTVDAYVHDLAGGFGLQFNGASSPADAADQPTQFEQVEGQALQAVADGAEAMARSLLLESLLLLMMLGVAGHGARRQARGSATGSAGALA